MHWSGRGLNGVLVYRAQDTFELKEDGEPRYPSGFVIALHRNVEDRVDSLSLSLEPAVSNIVFQRRVTGAMS